MLTEQHVATRLVRLCLRRDGALSRSPLLASSARAALLAELALQGMLASSASGLELDTTATGFTPADNMLAAVAAQPDKSMEWWVRRGTDAIHDTVAELIATGLWTRQMTRFAHRYRDTDPASLRSDAAQVRQMLDHAAQGTPAQGTPATAVLAALIGVLGTDEQLGGQRPTESLLSACGAARWLMGDLIDYLLARRRMLQAAATEARIALTANFIQ